MKCELCDGLGYYVAATRPNHLGEPDEVTVTCECQDYEDYEE